MDPNSSSRDSVRSAPTSRPGSFHSGGESDLEGSAAVVLLDTGAGRNAGAARDLLGAAPRARVVALAAPESEEDIIALAEAGVLGYVTRDEPLDKLVTTIESVARDEMACSPWMATVLVRRVQALAAERPGPTQRLTAREAEILELIAQGLSN